MRELRSVRVVCKAVVAQSAEAGRDYYCYSSMSTAGLLGAA